MFRGLYHQTLEKTLGLSAIVVAAPGIDSGLLVALAQLLTAGLLIRHS